MKQVINAHQVRTSRCPSRLETHVQVLGDRKYVSCTPPGMSIEEHIGNLIGDSYFGAGVDMYHPISYTRPEDAKAIIAAEQAAQKILDDAYAASVAAAKEAEQLLMKKEMLENPTLVWEPGLRETLIEETNQGIDAYNKSIQTGQSLTKSTSETIKKVAETVKKSSMIPVMIALCVLILIFTILSRRH